MNHRAKQTHLDVDINKRARKQQIIVKTPPRRQADSATGKHKTQGQKKNNQVVKQFTEQQSHIQQDRPAFNRTEQLDRLNSTQQHRTALKST